jgi:hypothetical protein
MDAPRWIGLIAAIALLAPVLFYAIPGSLIGLLLPCTAEAGLEVATYDGKQFTVSCSAAGLLVKTGLASVGTATLTFCAFVVGIVDLGSDSGGL